MARKVLFLLAAVALPSLLLVSVESGVAQALPLFPGSVSCNAAGGSWSGAITFSPPLSNTGVASVETFKVVAKLGTTTNSGLTSTTNPGSVIGVITGKLKFSLSGGANNCGAIFSGSALPAPVGAISRFVLKWLTPAGVATVWKHPPAFSVTGAAGGTSITVTGGKVTGSFSPFASSAIFSDANWSTAVPAGCASVGGLSSLSLGTSSGTW